MLWAATFGIALFLAYLLAGVLCCLTVIGISFGLQGFKLAAISIWPVGRRVVPVEAARMVRDERAADLLASYRGV
ncbi:YccF domain-containing protein [Paracoccus aminovorans]|uniref:YccF domain-containing protein n=1 Tax=Paracoccus aminovorans TaxID=34004 RepID=UPI0018D59840|nr:YccF domain-containing protein [Paracoccus aminovorans]